MAFLFCWKTKFLRIYDFQGQIQASLGQICQVGDIHFLNTLISALHKETERQPKAAWTKVSVLSFPDANLGPVDEEWSTLQLDEFYIISLEVMKNFYKSALVK